VNSDPFTSVCLMLVQFAIVTLVRSHLDLETSNRANSFLVVSNPFAMLNNFLGLSVNIASCTLQMFFHTSLRSRTYVSLVLMNPIAFSSNSNSL
jgi:hypothetical protein